jgi:hypothetical protein
MPTASGECVFCTTNHACATLCIHVPLIDTTWPKKYSR